MMPHQSRFRQIEKQYWLKNKASKSVSTCYKAINNWKIKTNKKNLADKLNFGLDNLKSTSACC